ncbi:hypothetical protein [Streptomyces sp. NPDC050485]|uniref:hypothetical protein n=1 Tax=Streptomyces sp. NPDC050485 TaxID=3365617 RepID=UPI0037A59A39
MRQQRSGVVRAARRVCAGAAIAALSVTGIVGLTSSAYADDGGRSVSFPGDNFNASDFNRIMNESPDDFAAEERANNPEGIQDRPVVDGNGIRWDTDGCSAPGILKGGDAEIACQRHDVGYRTLQQNGLWNEDSMSDANRRFDSDLTSMENAGRVSTAQGELLSGGVAVGTNLPSSAGGYEINGLPAFDGSSGSPYDGGTYQPWEGAR